MEELRGKFNLVRESLSSLIHGLQSELNRELKREAEGKTVKWKIFQALNYIKVGIVKSRKVIILVYFKSL